MFYHIRLLNMEGKICFGIVAHRLLAFLQYNNLIGTSVQKTGIHSFCSCQIQTAKDK